MVPFVKQAEQIFRGLSQGDGGVNNGGGAALAADREAEAPIGEEAIRRPMRADAVRNRRRILEAAEEVFAVQGVSAPIDVVAERAGVGVGTLYRHFPTKEALFEAIVLTRLEELVSAATACKDTEDAGEALFSFLRMFAHMVGNKHDLIDALGAEGIDIKSRCSGMADDLELGVERMLRRAQDAGAVRTGMTTKEVLSLLIGVCHASEHSNLDGASQERMVDCVCDGLRPSSTT
jgi:AcrR family transcriptional regulator